ncbi:putative BRCT domain-containing protein [Helianthus annuus]|uniref:BRCT domain-containing protein n=1 Tax=Helianthus annuus TaxID=4232 RepID=A0A251V7S6_HELAN|nr:putative BRCT domain-containing protein [Helianthus annuus]
MVGNEGVKGVFKKSHSRLLVDITCKLGSSSFRGVQSSNPSMSPATSSVSNLRSSSLKSPFYGLIVCVTGLSKEARKQVMDATERLGGQYSPHLHPRCTHLVVQISFFSGGRKFEHALKHGATNGLFIVTLGWFVDSVRRNVRLNEALYVVRSLGENHTPKDDINMFTSGNSCLPVAMLENARQSSVVEKPRLFSSEEELKRRGSLFSGQSIYVDPEVSAELQNKVVEAAFGQGCSLVDQWLPGHNPSHVVCEESSVQKYLGHSNYLVTPLWVLKTVKETRPQRLVHLSADLARQIGMMLDNVQGAAHHQKDICRTISSQEPQSLGINSNYEENQNIVNLAKNGVRNRRGRRMQAPVKPLTPSTLLDSICWSISDPSSNAAIYTDIFIDTNEDVKESDASFVNSSRPLSDAEKNELVFKNHFLTILFPVDRFSEMGPSSRTYFSDTGFTCLQLLDHIHAFYQENMSKMEIELAIHTDSRHADKLRSVYASKEAAEHGYAEIKRIEFLGSRKSFEMLKRVSGDNNSNVYELLTRA